MRRRVTEDGQEAALENLHCGTLGAGNGNGIPAAEV